VVMQHQQKRSKAKGNKVNNGDELIENLKMEIAAELGIIEQINNEGWASLSPRLSGKIGGILSQRLKKIKNK